MLLSPDAIMSMPQRSESFLPRRITLSILNRALLLSTSDWFSTLAAIRRSAAMLQ
jgi:hypothetical protein